VAIDHSKLNHYWQENGVYLPSWHFNNWEGTALTHGATGADQMVFHSEGSAAPQIAMLGWIVQDFNTTFTTTPSTVVHALGNIISPYESGPPPYTKQAYFADILHPTSKQVMQTALDRLRYMGILDLAINFPHAQY